MIIKLSLTLSSNHQQNLALPHAHQSPCPLSVLSDWVTGDSPLCIVYIKPQHSTLLAYGNLNGPLPLPSLIQPFCNSNVYPIYSSILKYYPINVVQRTGTTLYKLEAKGFKFPFRSPCVLWDPWFSPTSYIFMFCFAVHSCFPFHDVSKNLCFVE